MAGFGAVWLYELNSAVLASCTQVKVTLDAESENIDRIKILRSQELGVKVFKGKKKIIRKKIKSCD